MHIRVKLSILAGLLFVPIVSLSAQTQKDKDAEEIRSYILTMDKVNRMYLSMSEIKQAAEKDPNLQKNLSAEAGDTGDQSLSSAVNKLSAYPAIVGIMANHGFTPRQFMVAEFAVIQSGFAAAALKMGAPREKLLSEGAVSAANLDFVTQHQVELEELAKKYPMQ